MRVPSLGWIRAAAQRFRALVAGREATRRWTKARSSSPPPRRGSTSTGGSSGSTTSPATHWRADRHTAALASVLFVDWGFAGNTTDYGDPRNSFLPDVIERRLGLPITLSVLMIEVGRRIGVGLHGVGMPGHFLVGVDGDPDAFIDPFHAGARARRSRVSRALRRVHGTAGAVRSSGISCPTSRASSCCGC